jgi:molybdate transport system permease protein
MLGAAAFATALLAAPLVGLLQRAPWTSIVRRLSDPAVLDALRVSLVVSVSATAVATVIGLPLAWALARDALPGARLIRSAVLVPMVLPPVVAGTALLYALGRQSPIGSRLDHWFGITLPFTTTGATIAAAFVALPFFITTVEAALRQLGTNLDEAAATCRSGPLTTLWLVTLPAIRSALIAGITLTWARALGEFGATLTFAGSVGGRTRTLPLQTFVALESDPETAIAISVLLLAISIAMLVALRNRITLR